jgi:hypothetical protein
LEYALPRRHWVTACAGTKRGGVFQATPKILELPLDTLSLGVIVAYNTNSSDDLKEVA